MKQEHYTKEDYAHALARDMNTRDMQLSRLVALRLNGVPLPAEVVVGGERVDTARFVESFRCDRREAWPAIEGICTAVQRPLVCEVALSLM